jgi:hypothetical protein
MIRAIRAPFLILPSNNRLQLFISLLRLLHRRHGGGRRPLPPSREERATMAEFVY